MNSKSFKERLVLKFIDKYDVLDSASNNNEIVEDANQIAQAIYLYVNAILAAHEGQKIEIVPQVKAVEKPKGSGILGFNHE